MKLGVAQIKFSGDPFSIGSSKASATIGKVFAIQVLQTMYSFGYDFIVSSDMTRVGNDSSWFFRKVAVERSKPEVVCVSPGSCEKITVINGDDETIGAIREAIVQEWTKGIKKEVMFNSEGFHLHQFYFDGFPWISEGEKSR